MAIKIFGLFLIAGYFFVCAAHPQTFHLIDYANLIFHEAGHWIFSPFGEFMAVLGGSLNQVLVPLIVAGYFFLHKQIYSGFVCLMWTGQNLTNVSAYAGDALRMRLPLLGGDSSIHDWNWLLIYTGQLRHAAGIAQSILALGWLLIFTGALGAAYSIYRSQIYEK